MAGRGKQKQGNQENQVDEMLKETEIGAMIARYKVLTISIVVIAVLGVISWGGYSYYMEQNEKKFNKLIFTFSQQEYRLFENQELDIKSFFMAYDKLFIEAGDFVGMLPVILKTADLLIERNKLDEALKVLLQGKDKFSSRDVFIKYLISSRLAAVYEDLGQTKNAIKELEGLVSASNKLMESKNYLDLGRLYLSIGDNEKARANLMFVIDNFVESEHTPIARLYLNKIK